MNYLPNDLTLDDTPEISLDAKPKFLSSSGSGYPWSFLIDKEEFNKVIALMLIEKDYLLNEIAEDNIDC